MKTPPTVGKKLNDPVLQIKKFKHYARASEETEAFTGDLYVDGKLLAPVKNEGTGGCHHVQAYGDKRELMSNLAAACKAFPNIPSEYVDGGLDFSLDLAISGLVSQMLDRKHLKSQLRDKIGFRVQGQVYAPGEFTAIKWKDTPVARERVMQRFTVEKWMNDEANAPVCLHLSEIHAALCVEDNVPA